MFAHSAEATAGVLRRHGVRRAALGQAQPERARPGRDRHRRGRGRGRRADPREHAARPGARHRVGPAGPGRRRRRALRRRRAPGGGAGRLGVPGGLSRAAHRRRRRRVLGSRRGGAAAGRRRCRPGGHRHVPRPQGAVEGAARAGAVVWHARHDGGGHPPSGCGDRVGDGRPTGTTAPAAAVPAPGTTKEDAMADSFGDRVAAAIAATGPLCAGIDPSSALLAAWG